jgi:hypothetical protein
MVVFIIIIACYSLAIDNYSSLVETCCCLMFNLNHFQCAFLFIGDVSAPKRKHIEVRLSYGFSFY